MKRTFRALFYLFIISSVKVYAGKSLGSLSDAGKGLMTDPACRSGQEVNCDFYDPVYGLADLLKSASTNECLALESLNSQGIPKCHEDSSKLKGLSNIDPTGAIVITYLERQSPAIADLISSVLKKDSTSKINLVVSRSDALALREDSSLLKLIDDKRVNIIYFKDNVKVKAWMQDYMEFVTIHNKPAVYQMFHTSEEGKKYQDRIACEIARACNLPFYIPKDIASDPYEARGMDMGGNLEILPGGTFVIGTQQSRGGYQRANRSFMGVSGPYAKTANQSQLTDSLEDNKNKVIELDITPFASGHVDEVFNIVKTKHAPPCNFAVLISSPKKAFELMDSDETKVSDRECAPFAYDRLMSKKKFSQEEIEDIYSKSCINGYQVSSFKKSEFYNGIKEDANKHWDILSKNVDKLRKELRKTSGCREPKFVEVPVFTIDSGWFKSEEDKADYGGTSFLTNLTNSLVYTPEKGASSVYTPRSFYSKFDQYYLSVMSELGVDVTYINDLELDKNNGGIHCFTNSIRLCK